VVNKGEEMKKFEQAWKPATDYSPPAAMMVEAGNGAWVKTEEAEALEQLNKEMLEVLKDAFEFIGAADDMEWEEYRPKKASIRSKIQSIINKAEEV